MRWGEFCIALLTAGCTTIGGEPVEGWPALKIVEHHVPHHVMRDRCARYVGFGMSPEACAEFDFAGKLCHIWLSTDFPPPSYVAEHERRHCMGYEHPGERELRKFLVRHAQTAGLGQKAD